MSKGKKVVKKISIALLTGVGIIAAALGAKNIFNPSKPKVDEDLAKLVESLDNKILTDLKNNEKYHISDDAQAYFSHVNDNSKMPLIGDGKYSIDFYGVLVDHSGSYNFKTEYELPEDVKSLLENAGENFYKVLNQEINNLVLNDVELSMITELDEEFKTEAFAKKFANYIGITNDNSVKEKGSGADFIPLLFEEPVIERVYTKEPVVIAPQTPFDDPVVVDEGEFYYISSFKVVGVESHRDSKNNILNSYIRVQEFEVGLDPNKQYTSDEIKQMFKNEVNENTNLFEKENTYTSQKIENYTRMKDLMRHSYNYHNPTKALSSREIEGEEEMINERTL